MQLQTKTLRAPTREYKSKRPTKKPFVPKLRAEWGRNVQAIPQALDLMLKTGRPVTICNGKITVD
jgi:hypothetical protein